MGEVLSIPEAAAHLDEVVERACSANEPALLTRDGLPVARIVPVEPEPMTVREFAAAWKSMPHLDPEEAELFARDLEMIRLQTNGPSTSSMTLREILLEWHTKPALPPDEAEAFAADIERARAESNVPPKSWWG